MSLDDRSPDDAQRDADALRGTLYDDIEQLRASVRELGRAIARELRLRELALWLSRRLP